MGLLIGAATGCGDDPLHIKPVEWSFIDGTLMHNPNTNQTRNARKELPADGYSDGLGGYLYMSPLIPDVGSYSSGDLPDFRTSTVVWTTPGRTMSLSWESRLKAVSEDLGYDKNDPLDIGLCVRRSGPDKNYFAHAVTRERVTTRKDVGPYKNGNVLYFEDRYIADVDESMTKNYEVELQICDRSETTTPNPFNYPRVYDRGCRNVNLCANHDELCTLDCRTPATVNASYRVRGIENPSGDMATTNPDVQAAARLGPTINVPAFAANGGTTVDVNIDGDTVPAPNQLSTIIRPLTWDPKRGRWTFTVKRNGTWVENFTKDYVIGAFRVFSVHTIEADANKGPMKYPGVEIASHDGTRRLRSQVSIRYKFATGVGSSVPSACIDRGQGVTSANCPQLSAITPAQLVGVPDVLTWEVDIPTSHPLERKTDSDLLATAYGCDYRIEPPSPTMMPCWWNSDILLTNRYYIEFFRPGQGNPTPRNVPPPGEGDFGFMGD